MGNFKIFDQNRNKQIIETHYFNWLQKTEKSNIHNSATKIEYLKEQGFQVGINFITEYEVETLKLIEGFYFQTVLKPKINELVNELSN